MMISGLLGFITLGTIWNEIIRIASSKYAIIAYVAILAIIILVLIISLASSVNKPVNVVMDDIDVSGVTVKGAVAATADTAETPDGEKSETEEGEEEDGENVKRFCMLPEIDERADSYKRDDYDDTITLEKLCSEFRNFAAAELKLYYDISDIRRFIAGLAVTKIIILQGMSGTGKTSLA